jgi:hypothetical protein
MQSQKYNKEELYPPSFTDDDKLNFDILLVQAKQLFPRLANDEWLIKQGIIAYMKKEKMEDYTPPSNEEIAEIRNRYTSDTVFETPQEE